MRLLVAGQKGFALFLEELSRRGEVEMQKFEKPVRSILGQVRHEGDRALLRLTRKFDGWPASGKNLRVGPAEMQAALKSLPRLQRSALRFAARRIRHFHQMQRQASWSYAGPDGSILGQVIRPLERVGIYVPGGKAAYPSSVLMNTIPAKVAGVPRIVMVSPAPGGLLNPAVLAAAGVAGVGEIFKVGGAQAVAALAFGTRTVPRVDKIVGPGNIYVALAKRFVFGEVAIDSIAGPSEILILADGSGEPALIAADLLSQAEHDERAAAILVCTSQDFGEKVRQEVLAQVARLPRRRIARRSLKDCGAVLIVPDLGEGLRIVNALAPEHLELAVAHPFKLLPKVANAGAVFLGHLSPEAIGDYVAGPNHVLPTGGTARFSSPLGVYDFIKRSSLICLSPEGLKKLAAPAMSLARMEGLEAHRQSIARREEWNSRS